jgi:hypothetical protein
MSLLPPASDCALAVSAPVLQPSVPQRTVARARDSRRSLHAHRMQLCTSGDKSNLLVQVCDMWRVPRSSAAAGLTRCVCSTSCAARGAGLKCSRAVTHAQSPQNPQCHGMMHCHELKDTCKPKSCTHSAFICHRHRLVHKFAPTGFHRDTDAEPFDHLLPFLPCLADPKRSYEMKHAQQPNHSVFICRSQTEGQSIPRPCTMLQSLIYAVNLLSFAGANDDVTDDCGGVFPAACRAAWPRRLHRLRHLNARMMCKSHRE